jgi:hypothetical protein
MTEWNPRDEMDLLSYVWFKFGFWVEVDTIPQWVRDASDPPPKTQIPQRGSVEAVFTGNSLEYKIITHRTVEPDRGVGTSLRSEYHVRIK